MSPTQFREEHINKNGNQSVQIRLTTDWAIRLARARGEKLDL